jgi:hypothetical protein
VPLRPLGLDDMLTGTVRYMRSNPSLALGVTAVVMVVVQAIQLLVEFALVGIDPAELAQGRSSGLVGSLIGTVGISLVSVVLGAVLAGLLLVALGQAVLGRSIGVRQAWQVIAPRVPGLIVLSLLVWLAIMVVVLAPTFLGLVFAATGSGGGIVLGLLLLVVAVVVTCYLGVLWVFAPAAYVLEPIGPMAALRRSVGLVRGYWWRTFGILLLTGLMIVIPAVVVMVVVVLLSVLLPPAAMLISVPLASVVLATFATPFGVGVTGLLYLDQRIRKERLDLELARSADWPAAPR